ncbi:MAG: metallophosphoesterase [Cyanobacteria bacterium P01_A01_bin.84]
MKNIFTKLKYVTLGIAGAIALVSAWSFIEPHTLNTENEVAKIPNLSESWHGKKIGQISDFQIGLWGDNRDTVRDSVTKLIEVKPAVVLISGDFLYHSTPNPEPEIQTAVNLVRPLVEAGIPTYAVLGNHDYGMSKKSASPNTKLANRLETALESAGIKVLENETVKLQLPNSNEPLYLVAVGSLWANRDNVQKALKGLPDKSPRIVMMHNPDTFEQFPSNSAPLAIAGHTHGGQVRIPGTPEWSWLRFTQKDKTYADGWAKGYGKPGNKLYVNIGIGMSIIPIRLFCPPELTLFTLQPN